MVFLSSFLSYCSFPVCPVGDSGDKIVRRWVSWVLLNTAFHHAATKPGLLLNAESCATPTPLALASALRVTGWHHDPAGIRSSKQNKCSISLSMVGRKPMPDSILPSVGQVIIGISSYVPEILQSQLFWLLLY